MTRRRRARVVAHRIAGLRGLPVPVAVFQAKVIVLAAWRDHAFAIQAASQPGDVKALLKLAAGKQRVVELGTATAWTTASLVLADKTRTVTSYDPVIQEDRSRYLALVPRPARARMNLVQDTGEAGAMRWDGGLVDFLFIDSTHMREDTVREFRAWSRHLADDAVVVFHDYGNPAFPGVADAVSELALHGEVLGGSFVTRGAGDASRRGAP